ncbi:Expansin-B5 [Trebouxia sp. C0009 RCD-2024]
MRQHRFETALLYVTLALAYTVCPSAGQTAYNTTVGQFVASEANGPANPSCGYGPLSMDSFPFGKVASINANSPLLQGLPQSGCGACFQLTCEAGATCALSSQPLVVQQIDSGTAEFSIRPQDFTALAPAYLGNVPVDCSISGDIIIRVLEHRSSGGGYIKLTFLNKIGGIESVLISTSQASEFQEMYNQNAAVWVASNLPPLPLDVRIISVSGQTVTAE